MHNHKKSLRALLLCLIMLAVICVPAAYAAAPQYAYVANRSVYFYDVTTAYPWAFHEIDYLATSNIIQGTDDYLFHPDDEISRADFVLMLYRAYDMSSYTSGQYFKDVSPNAYYADAVLAARSLDIVTGENNQFFPSRSITHAEANVMLARTLERAGINLRDGDISSFADAASVKAYAQQATGKLVAADIINGNTKNELRPTAHVTRAEMAVMLYRALMIEETTSGPRYAAHPDRVNVCIGDKIYSGATISNYNASRSYKGLVEYSDFQTIGGAYYVSIGNSTTFGDRVTYYDGILRVNGQVVEMAEDIVCVQVEPYSVLSEPVTTGNQYHYAKVCYDDKGKAQIIYYAA